MTSAEVSKKYNISIDTLRYYEKIGLLPPIKRDSKGYRVYTQQDCNWIYYIKVMRNAGVSIEALIEYFDLFQKGESTINKRKTILLEQRDQLAKKVQEMQDTLAMLTHKIDIYEELLLKFEDEKLRGLEN